MNWTALLGDATVTTSIVPVWVSLLGAVFVVVTGLKIRSLAPRSTLHLAWRIVIALGLTLMQAVLILIPVVGVFLGHLFGSTARLAANVFGEVVFAGFFLSSLATGLGAFFWRRIDSRCQQAHALRVERAKLAGSWAVAQLAGLFSLLLVLVDTIPRFELDGPLALHKNQAATLSLRVDGDKHQVWHATPLHLSPSQAAARSFVLHASCWIIQADARVQVEVGEDRPDPRFPLEVGNRWTYSTATHRSTVVGLGLISANSSEEDTGQVTVEVVGTSQVHEGGLKTYRVRSSRADNIADAYNLDGKVYLITEGVGTPLLRSTQGDQCQFALFPGFGCTCGTTPVAGDLAGPTGCTKSDDSALSSLGSAGLMIITGFMVISPPSGSALSLVETKRRAGGK